MKSSIQRIVGSLLPICVLGLCGCQSEPSATIVYQVVPPARPILTDGVTRFRVLRIADGRCIVNMVANQAKPGEDLILLHYEGDSYDADHGTTFPVLMPVGTLKVLSPRGDYTTCVLRKDSKVDLVAVATSLEDFVVTRKQ